MVVVVVVAVVVVLYHKIGVLYKNMINMNILGKNIVIILILFMVIPAVIYIMYKMSTKEGLANNTSTNNGTNQQGTYVMTNTTYDTNGNIVVKTMDTSGNFSVNTYGSTIINQTPAIATAPTTTNTNTIANANPATYQMQMIPPINGTTATNTQPSISANDISTIASAAIAAAMNAYQQSHGNTA